MKTAKSLWSILLIAVFFRSCKKDETLDPTNEAYENANPSKGGIMYDKFWSTESGFNQNDLNLTIFNASNDFFHCKQCHGWDG